MALLKQYFRVAFLIMPLLIIVPIGESQTSSHASGQRLTADNADAVLESARTNLLNSTKSEFESTSEYHNRLANLADKVFWNGRKADDTFTFMLGQAWAGGAPVRTEAGDLSWLYGAIVTSYDAESKKLTVKIPFEPLEESGTDWVSQWGRIQSGIGSYVGVNSFGVKKKVDRLSVKETDLVIEDTHWLDSDCDHEFDGVSCSFEIDEDAARLTSHNVRVIVAGSIAPPFTSFESDISQPTIANPAEIHHLRRFLYLSLKRLSFVDSRSGAILRTYSAERHASEYPINLDIRIPANAPFSDPRCKENAYLFPSSIISVDYNADGVQHNLQLIKDGLHIEARSFIDLQVTYCNISRLDVRLNGNAYKLECEEQGQYIANSSKCKRIELER